METRTHVGCGGAMIDAAVIRDCVPGAAGIASGGKPVVADTELLDWL